MTISAPQPLNTLRTDSPWLGSFSISKIRETNVNTRKGSEIGVVENQGSAESALGPELNLHYKHFRKIRPVNI
jgi:hypothetical protein